MIPYTQLAALEANRVVLDFMEECRPAFARRSRDPRLSVEERSVGWMEFVMRRWCESRGVACIALPAPTAVAAAYAGACGRGGTSPCAPREPPRRSTPLAELSPEQERSMCWPGADEHTEQAQGASDFAATTPSDPAPRPPPPPLKRAVSPVGTTAKWYRRVRISPDSAKSAVSAAPAGDDTMSSDVGGSGAGGAAACEQQRSDDSGSDRIEPCSASSSPCPSSSSDGESAWAASKDQRSDGSDSVARDTVMAGADEAAAGGDTPPAADLGTAAAAAAASSNAEDARRVLEVIVEEADLATVDTAAAAARSSARVDETTSHTLDVNGDLTRDSEDLLQERLSPSDDDAGVNVPPPPPRPPAGSPIVGGDDMYDGECGGDGGAAALYESGDAVLSFPDHIALERVDDDAGAGAEEDVIQFYGDVAALDIAAAHDVAGASSAPAEQIEVAGMDLYGGGGDSGGGGGDVLHQGGVPTGANDTGAGMPTSRRGRRRHEPA